MELKVGDTFKYLKGPGKPYKIHIVAFIENDMVVTKWYGRHKQWWHYEINPSPTIEMQIKLFKELK